MPLGERDRAGAHHARMPFPPALLGADAILYKNGPQLIDYQCYEFTLYAGGGGDHVFPATLYTGGGGDHVVPFTLYGGVGWYRLLCTMWMAV